MKKTPTYFLQHSGTLNCDIITAVLRCSEWRGRGRSSAALLPDSDANAKANPPCVPTGATAVGDGAPLHPGAGRRRHHREAGSEHQAAVALRRSLHQGGRSRRGQRPQRQLLLLILLSAACCVYPPPPPPLRLLQLKEWIQNRGWSSSPDRRRLSSR